MAISFHRHLVFRLESFVAQIAEYGNTSTRKWTKGNDDKTACRRIIFQHREIKAIILCRRLFIEEGKGRLDVFSASLVKLKRRMTLRFRVW